MRLLEFFLGGHQRSSASRVIAKTTLLICLGLAVVVWAAGGVALKREALDHPEPQAAADFGAVFGVGDLTGDGINEFVVSAINQDVGGNADQGRAYVFNGADRSLLFTLDTPNPLPAAAFGAAVADAGDVDHDGTPDMIIGAPIVAFGPTPSPGQAFVFSGATAALLFVLDDPEPPAVPESAFFGTAVAGVGDVDGDGYPDLFVGESRSAGQAFLFSGFDGSLIREFVNPLPGVVFQFGIAVAALGDVNANGVPDIAIGSIGRVFVFDGNGVVIRTLENPSPGFFNIFGGDLASVGDINLDGITDLLVGDFAGAENFVGQAFVFSGSNGDVLFTLTNPDPPQSLLFAFFGRPVAGVGDMDSDGVPDLLVGALNQRPNLRARAAVSQAFLFSGTDGRLLRRIVGPGPHNDFDFFGNDLAGPGDLNGDGVPDLLVGASGTDVDQNSDQGRVYVYLSNH